MSAGSITLPGPSRATDVLTFQNYRIETSNATFSDLRVVHSPQRSPGIGNLQTLLQTNRYPVE